LLAERQVNHAPAPCRIALLFFVVAVLANMGVNIGSVMIENFLFSRYKRVRAILILMAFAFFKHGRVSSGVTMRRIIATVTSLLTGWEAGVQSGVRSLKRKIKKYFAPY